MTLAITAPAERRAGLDLSWPILIAFAAILVALIVLPMSWLIYFSLTDKGTFTLANFVKLVSDPTFLDPLVTTVILATSSAIICCAVAAPTREPGAEPLFDIYTLPGLIFVISCYTFPYVFVLVANALDRIPGDLEDASSILGGRLWVTARRVTIPLALPALLAGALVAFLQAMTPFGPPALLALPAGVHTMTTKIWSLFQYPPKPELAAAASLPLLVLTVMLLRAEAMILGRRGYSVVGGKNSEPRIIRLGYLRWVALVFCFIVLLNPVFLPYGALLNAALSPVATQFVTFGT